MEVHFNPIIAVLLPWRLPRSSGCSNASLGSPGSSIYMQTGEAHRC